MNKKIIIFVLVICLSFVVINKVQAGFIIDYGELDGNPGSGEANWMAWHATFPDGKPVQILTEDSTNCGDGVDIGYSELSVIFPLLDSDTNLEWILQVENFTPTPYPGLPDYQPVNMLFGGLGANSGTLWQYSINPWLNTEAFSDHGVIPPLEGEYPACPTLYAPTESDPSTLSFYSTEPGTYLVYRSQNASGASNDASNGRYDYFTSVTTATGYATFTDTSQGPNWYIVFQFDPDADKPIGCHSELAGPTNVRVMNFEAEYKASEQAVILNWETASEMDVVGFNVLRSESEDGEKNKLNGEDLIAATPGGTGSSYSYVDSDVEFGHTYYYWLEIIGFNGRDEILGPRPAPVFYQLFLPLFN